MPFSSEHYGKDPAVHRGTPGESNVSTEILGPPRSRQPGPGRNLTMPLFQAHSSDPDPSNLLLIASA